MSVHNPKKSIPLSVGSVEISELRWPDALHLYQRLTSQVKDFTNEKGDIVLSTDRIVAAITENIELGTWVVLKATGKDQTWLDERSLGEVLDIATEATVLNVGIIMDRIKNAKGRLRDLVAGPQPALSPAPQP